ncbi:MAG TPA: protein-L-isoaspartate(D-aspartate) O-methyltransferase, partial [Thermoguttaceae bacterium]|nr:protein-L-isoaspartate(D-aspartate) O-methyltransferase [Thermoguttaceae bacterium]
AVGDGTLGWPNRSPYDRIIVTAAAARSPPALFEQLQEEGILVIPVGAYDYQHLQVIRKVDGSPRSADLSPCRFVPLVGAQGWPE